jgi:succinate dehydrogenase hydrophobic anchor subunit
MVIIGTILAPISPVFAQSNAQFDTSTLEKSGIRDELSCSFADIDVGNCIAIALYFFAYTIPAGILGLTANFFNATIGLTLSSKLYYLSSFIEDGWSLVRDIANIFFIFILLFVALQTILGFGASTKKTIAKLIMVAILINFSMFFVKVIIDTSNILALVFYNRITITANDADKNPAPYNQVVDKSLTNIDEKDVAGAFVSAFNPQVLTDPDYISIFQDTARYSYVDPTTNQTVSYEKKNMNVTKIMIILIFTGIIFLYASWCFFIAGVSLFGRLIGLWLSIILAPIACVTYIMPSLQSQFKQIGWKEWWTNLMTLAFNAPIFMFFIYLIILLSKSDLISSINLLRNPDQDFIVILLLIAIPMLIIMGFLQMATDFAKKMGGEIGQGFVKFAENAYKNVGGFGVGMASGVVAMGLQAKFGRDAQKTLADKDLQDRASKGDAGAQQKLRRAEYLATRSFDLRDTAIGKFGAKKLKIDTGATKGLEQFLATPGIFGSKPKDISTRGGAQGRTERAKKLENEDMSRMKMRGMDADVQDRKAKEWQKEYDKDLENTKKKEGPDFNEENFKVLYEKGKAKIYDENGDIKILKDSNGNPIYDRGGTTQVFKSTAKILDSKTTNQLRIKDQADLLEFGEDYIAERARVKETIDKKRAEEALVGKMVTKEFDEKKWREGGGIMVDGKMVEYLKRDRDNNIIKSSLSRQNAELVNDLRNQVGGLEKETGILTGKALTKATTELKTTEREFQKLGEILETIKPKISEIDPVDLEKRITDIKETMQATSPAYKGNVATGLDELKLYYEQAKKNGDIPDAVRMKREIDAKEDIINSLKKGLENYQGMEEKISDLRKKIGK